LDQGGRWHGDSGPSGTLQHRQARHAELLDEFASLGGTGIEVVTGSHRPEHVLHFARLAEEFGLLASRGSDFHAPGEGGRELGRMPPLPERCMPVWQAW
jgi:predicted metal-dependent phosphoesterase TrpH